jgi:serine/threonine protein kinase
MNNLYFVINEIFNSNREFVYIITGMVMGVIIAAIIGISVYYWVLTSHNSKKLQFQWPLKENTYLNEFEVKKMVGYGGYGQVYKTLNKCDQKIYAIKKVKLNGKITFNYIFLKHFKKQCAILALNENEHKRLVNEIQLWAKVSSSNYFVQLNTFWYENVKDDPEDQNGEESPTNTLVKNIKFDPFYTKITGKVLHIQMEFCRMTLGKAIKKINEELDQSVKEPITKLKVGLYISTQLFAEIVNAVNYLHTQKPKILHRDLKPANIFITDSTNGNFIKIGDFGLAVEYRNMDENDHKNIKDYIELSQGCGTLNYMAPEVLNSKIYNEKCDIYSLGAVGWDLCRNW